MTLRFMLHLLKFCRSLSLLALIELDRVLLAALIMKFVVIVFENAMVN